ncbi:MAG: amidohydrolase family protein [Bryobacterales bacterium]|nr:amidohydrolase family protein [Bryobacterales bacterium]
MERNRRRAVLALLRNAPVLKSPGPQYPRRPFAGCIAVPALCWVLGFGAFASAQQAIAIRDATVVTVSGPTLRKGTVVLRSGLIEAVGPEVASPADAWIIEGEGLNVYPGLIDGASNWGMPQNLSPGGMGRGGRGPEDRPGATTWVKAADELQPSDPRLERARSAGFTTAAVFPMRGIFCGQGSIVNLAGERAGDMVLAPRIGQFLTMSQAASGFPAALMGTIAYIRQVYLDAGRYAALKEAYQREPRGIRRPDYDRALEGVLESKRILLPANRRVEIDRMQNFAAELGQPAILYGMQEGYRSIDLLKKAGAPVLVNLRWPERGPDTNPDQPENARVLEMRDRAPSTAAELAKAKVKFAFYSGGLDQPRDLQKAIKKAIGAGLPRSEAVRALTLAPAEIYGVADRLGSIDKGKIANLVVTRGELFDDNTRIEMVFVDGKRFLTAPETTAPGGRGPVTNRGNER